MADIPQWAINEAVLLLDGEHGAQFPSDSKKPYSGTPGDPAEVYPQVRVIARLIAKHEEPPVDPLLLIAREIAASRYPGTFTARAITDGQFDGLWIGDILTALRRGIEIEREQRS